MALTRAQDTELADSILEFIANNVLPEDVFSHDALVDWAERNNFYESVEE